MLQLKGNTTAMPNCQRINTLEIIAIVRWLTPVLHQEWCTESVLQMWAAAGKSYSCVNLPLINFDQFLPRPKQQQIGTHRCLPPLWCYTDVRCQVHLCKVIQCSCILGNCRLGVGCPDQKITWQPLALLDGCHEPRIALLQQLIRSTVARVGVGGWQC